MTRIEHANLVVQNLDATLSFLQIAMPDWQVRGRGKMTWRGRPRQWLHFGNAEDYITLNDGAVGDNRDLEGDSPGLAHLGFVVPDLTALHQRLQSAGYQVDIEGPEHPFRRNLYYLDPAGFQFEFVEYLSRRDDERNSYDRDTGSQPRRPARTGEG